MKEKPLKPYIDFYIIKDYTYTDGEDDVGPDIYLLRAHTQREAVDRINDLFAGSQDMLKLLPIHLPLRDVVYLGTFLRENLDEFIVKIPGIQD